MSLELKTIICGTAEDFEKLEWANPLPNKNFFDLRKIKPFIRDHQESVHFIVILLSLFERPIDSLLEEIGDNDSIVAIFICDNQVSNSTNNRRKVSYVSKSLLTCKTATYAIHLYELASQNRDETNQEGVKNILEQKITGCRNWLNTYNKVNAFDILITRLNATAAQARDYQQRVIEFCTELYPGYDLTVYTIDDILSDESDPDISEDERDLIIKRNQVICLLAETLAPIRLCVVGNEEGISNEKTELIIGVELNSDDPDAPQYGERCTFVENEPVTDQTRENLVRRYGGLWKKRKLIRLDTIRDQDAFRFLDALDHSCTTRRNREMIANEILSGWTANYHENNPKCSDKHRAIGQAQDGPMEQDDNSIGEIINPIQSVRPAHVQTD